MAGMVKNGPKPCGPMYWEVIWHIKRFPGWFPALELACHCDLIFTSKISHLWPHPAEAIWLKSAKMVPYHHPIYVWEVFWCNRSLKWAELWSQQPWEWPKRLKSEEKWPQNGQFLSIGIFLWHRNYSHINIYWHPWFGPIFSTFGYLEVSFAHNFFILLRMSWKEPAPLNLIRDHKNLIPSI